MYEWVAVAFDRKMFIGQFQQYSKEDDLSEIHFVEKSSLASSNSFVWPEISGKKADISWVEDGMLFLFWKLALQVKL